jgi:hypothetical protein
VGERLLAEISFGIIQLAKHPLSMVRASLRLRRSFIWPALFATIWLWLYAVSGFLLKASRRFDIGFHWR